MNRYYDSNGLLIDTSLSSEDTEKVRTLVRSLPAINALNNYANDIQVVAKHAYDIHKIRAIADSLRTLADNAQIYKRLADNYPDIKNGVLNYEHTKKLFKDHYDALLELSKQSKHDYESAKNIVETSLDYLSEMYKQSLANIDSRVDKAKQVLYNVEADLKDKANIALDTFHEAKDIDKRLAHIEATLAVERYHVLENDEALAKAKHLIQKSESLDNCEKENKMILDYYQEETDYDYILMEDN